MKFLFPALLAFVVGCGGAPTGPKMYPVSGTLTVGGKPVKDVNVQLVPEDLSKGTIISGGKTDAAGKYSVTGTNGVAGAVAGKYKVVLNVAGTAPAPGQAHDGQTAPVVTAPFPEEYNSSATSPKSVEVVDKAVTLDISL
jgi:hypothetical protein